MEFLGIVNYEQTLSKENYEEETFSRVLEVNPVPLSLEFPLITAWEGNATLSMLVSVEEGVKVVPIVITLKDDLGNPVMYANVTLAGVKMAEVSPGTYALLIPVSKPRHPCS